VSERVVTAVVLLLRWNRTFGYFCISWRPASCDLDWSLQDLSYSFVRCVRRSVWADWRRIVWQWRAAGTALHWLEWLSSFICWLVSRQAKCMRDPAMGKVKLLLPPILLYYYH